MNIGQTVKVRRLRDQMPSSVISQIKQNPVGVIKDFRVVDGSGVGVVVEFSTNQLTTWFFEDELEAV
ncbi:MAG: DUF2862 domain-containing protein [Cyanobacteria bacterium LVE1205-1]|jgi:hypothetical protein|nr:DUF2862 domain-containing protein [Cyanobacteria bacterium WB6_1B_304]